MPGKPKRLKKRSRFTIVSVVCAIGVVLTSLPALSQKQTENKNPSAVTAQPTGKAFRRPADASAALYAAARRDDENALLVILGPDARDLVNWTDDRNERAQQRKMFADKYEQMHRLVKEPDNTVALYVGAENWPVPIPIVEYKGKWYFDAALGKQEVLYRRIGRNEMEALQVCQALIDAEKEYYSAEHKYTANFTSNGDAHDGLYWKASAGEQESPVGPFLARAGLNPSSPASGDPYNGYYYRILLKPNSAANAGGGFAVLAFPAEYRSSGVKTFMVEQDGMAYEADLGAKTAELAKEMNTSSADASWSKVE